jgi:uncharacterized protein (TIGR03437 family)
VTILGAGACVITASQTGNTSYSAAPTIPQNLTVNKAMLTVTANNASSTAGSALPTFTASFTGFVNGDTAAVVSGAPSLTTTATSSSGAGTYPIVTALGTLSAANYSFTLVNGTLTIYPVATSFGVSPLGVILQYPQGLQPASFTQTFTVTSTPGIGGFSVISSVPWLTAPVSGTTGFPYTVTVNTSGLAVGSYQGTLVFSSAAGTAQVIVSLTIAPPVTLSSQPSLLNLLNNYGSSVATPADVQIASTSAAPFTVTSDSPWLTFTTSGTSLPATIHILANPSGLPAAMFQGTITVTVPGATNSPFSIPVDFSVIGTGAPNQTAVDSSASFTPGFASPDSILTLFGPLQACTSTPQILVGGSAVPVLFANSTQVNFVIPGMVSTTSGNDATIQVVCNGNPVETVSVPAATVDPAVYTQTGTGTGQASIVNADGTVNAPGNPAIPGTYLSVYGTGFGPLNPPSPDGLQRLTYPVTATIGGVSVPVLYAGQAPTETVGLVQINLQLPAGLPAGIALPIVLTANGVASQVGVTVAIQ